MDYKDKKEIIELEIKLEKLKSKNNSIKKDKKEEHLNTLQKHKTSFVNIKTLDQIAFFIALFPLIIFILLGDELNEATKAGSLFAGIVLIPYFLFIREFLLKMIYKD